MVSDQATMDDAGLRQREQRRGQGNHDREGELDPQRTHLGLEKECHVSRAIEPPESGQIRKSQVLSGLHHRYFREVA